MKYTTEYHVHHDANTGEDMPDVTGWYIVGRYAFGPNNEYGACRIVAGPYPTREAADIDAPSVIGG